MTILLCLLRGTYDSVLSRTMHLLRYYQYMGIYSKQYMILTVQDQHVPMIVQPVFLPYK